MIAIVLLLLVQPLAPRGGAIASQPATQAAASQPAAAAPDPALRQRVDALVEKLRSRSFEQREAAQHALEKLGDDAMPLLARLLDDADEEVSTRVASILVQARDPALQVDLAVRLIASGDPDWMERGVHMLFRGKPDFVCERFAARTHGATGTQRIVFDVVREQLSQWKRTDAAFWANYRRIRKKSPEKAEALLKTNADTYLYQAEAAYWAALEALEDSREFDWKQPTSRPGGAERP